MVIKKLLFITAILAFAGSVGAQTTFSISGGSIPAGGSGSLSLSMDNSGAEIQGWSFGACSDPDFLTVDAANSGADTDTAKNGSAPDFNTINTYVDGATQGVVLCFTGCAVLADVTAFEMLTIDYTGVVEGSTSVAYCSSLGDPPVETVVVVGGASVPPVQNSAAVDVLGVPDPEYTYTAGNGSANYNPADGNASATVAISIGEVDNSGLGGTFPNTTQGFSMGLSNSAEVTPTGIVLDLGFDADFAEDSLFANGWTVGVVYSFTGGSTIDFDSDLEIIAASYETGGSMAGDETGTTASLSWSDELGSPAVANVVVVGGGSYAANFVDGSIALNPVVTTDFIRGDANSDARINIADGVWIINELFLNGPSNPCAIANDANNDGSTDAGDAVYIFQYRFTDGPQPPAPFPSCGQVDGQTPEDCAASSCS
jgi:hypothetical protein